MFSYTAHNHFRFGYADGSRFEARTSAEQKFIAEFGRCKKRVFSWRKANLMACREIGERAVGPVWVLFSGGTDSEICIRSFREAKVPFKVATLRYKGGWNEHDLAYVDKFARAENIEVTYFDLDLVSYWESGRLFELADPIHCVSPILASHLWLADQLDGTPVIAQGEPHLRKDIPADYVPGESPYLPSPWRLLESERLCSLYRHFIRQDRPAVPGFFQYLPEQFYSYLAYNSILRDLVANRIIGKLGTRSSKNLIAQQYYPEVEARTKYTGFETVTETHDRMRSTLAERYPHSDGYYSIEYGELLKMLQPKFEPVEMEF